MHNPLNPTKSCNRAKGSFSRRSILNVALIGLLLLFGQASPVFALVNATWSATPVSGVWNSGVNWVGAAVPTGTATFGLSSTTALSLSSPAAINDIAFNAGASAYTITLALVNNLSISGGGITNSSGITQNFVLNGGAGTITPTIIAFTNSATAGDGVRFTLNGGVGSGMGSQSQVTFDNTSTAGSASFIIHSGTPTTMGCLVRFLGSSTAGSGSFTTYGPSYLIEDSGGVSFLNSSTAGSGSFTNNGGTVSGTYGGVSDFENTATAGSATITNRGGAVSGASGGQTWFTNSSTAGSANITALGGVVSGAFGGQLYFGDTTSAGSSTLTASGGTNGGGGGEIQFGASSDGGTARVIANGNGFLDISDLTGAGMGIGSIEGSGIFLLGSKTLTVGGNNLSATVSGVIQDGGHGGGVGGALTKVGSGTLTLSGANTYTGATTISAGALQIGAGGTTGSLSTSSAIVNNATLIFNRSNTMTQGIDFASGISGTGAVTQSGSGKTILTGANTYSGVTTVQAGTLQFGTVSALYNGVGASWTAANIIVHNGATLALTVGGATGFTSGNVDTIKALGGAANGFMNGSTFGLDTSAAPGGTFTYASAIGDTNGGANSIGFAKLGTGTLILTGPLTYTGATTVLGGSLQIAGNLNVGSGGLTVGSGGTLSVGSITATSSLLEVDGTLTTPQLTLLGTSVLGGNGVLNGNLINNGGTVAPGHSPGTLSIIGDFTQARNGTLQIQIGSVNWFDHLNVSGKASLGGTLQVQNWAGNTLSYGQQVEFLHAGSIVGSFDNITMPDPSKFRGRFLVDGGTGTLLVAPESYALVAANTNQRNVAKALDHYITAVGNDREVVSTALDKQSENQYATAFNAISPAFHETIANITIEQAFDQTQLLNQRLSSVRLGAQGFQLIGMNAEPLAYDKDGKKSADPKDLKTVIQQDNNPNWSAWAMGSGVFGKMTDVSQIPNGHSESGSCLIGADYRWSDCFSTGLYGGYQGTYVDYTNKSSNHMNTALFGGYATYKAGGFYTDAILGGGYNSYAVRRTVEFSTINRTAMSDQQSGQLNAALNIGYDFKVAGFTLGPVIGAQYTYVGIAPFTEAGASSLNLSVKEQNANSLRTTLGGRIAYTWNVSSKIVLIPEIRMLWENEFLNGSRAIGAALDGGRGPSFSSWTDAPQRSSAFAGAGVSAQIGANWNASLFYNVDFGRQSYLANMVSASLGIKF